MRCGTNGVWTRCPLPSKTGAVSVLARAADATTDAASATRASARSRPLTERRLISGLRPAERPELVADEVERRHEDDRDGLRYELPEVPVRDEEVEDVFVRGYGRHRDKEE